MFFARLSSPTMITAACTIISWDCANGNSVIVAAAGFAWKRCVAVSASPTCIAGATAGGCLRASTHSMFARILARSLLLTVHTLIAVMAEATTIVVCKSANRFAVAAARVATRDLVFTVLAIVSMVTMACTIPVCQIARDTATVTA